jgi:predicted thioesterase
VKHLAATPIGMTVEAVATMVEKNNKILIFSVIARDETGIIGEGTIKRAIVTRDSFINKAQQKNRGPSFQ